MDFRSGQLDFATVFDEVLRARLAHVHTSHPARVIDYDPVKQTANVLPVTKHMQLTTTGYEPVDYPVIPDVPVAFPRWGDWYVHAPLTPGDYVELLYGEASLDRWREFGLDDIDPEFPHRFDLSDAIAVPANIYPVAKTLVGLASTGFEIGKATGAKVYLDDTGGVHLGTREALDPVVVASRLIPVLQSFIPALASIQNTVALLTPLEPSTYAPALAAFQAALTALQTQLAQLAPPTIGSSKVTATT